MKKVTCIYTFFAEQLNNINAWIVYQTLYIYVTHSSAGTQNDSYQKIGIYKNILSSTTHLVLKISGQPLYLPHVVCIIYLECLQKKKQNNDQTQTSFHLFLPENFSKIQRKIYNFVCSINAATYTQKHNEPIR